MSCAHSGRAPASRCQAVMPSDHLWTVVHEHGGWVKWAADTTGCCMVNDYVQSECAWTPMQNSVHVQLIYCYSISKQHYPWLKRRMFAWGRHTPHALKLTCQQQNCKVAWLSLLAPCMDPCQSVCMVAANHPLVTHNNTPCQTASHSHCCTAAGSQASSPCRHRTRSKLNLPV